MQKQELHDILYRQQLSMSDKNKLYNFIKKFVDLFKGDKIDDKYLPKQDIELKTLDSNSLKGTGDIKLKTINGTKIIGSGNIVTTETLKTINGVSIKGNGDITISGGLSTINTGTGVASEIFNDSTNVASSDHTHAEGYGTKATAYYAHAEGNESEANGQASHAEGYSTVAGGEASHAEGYENESNGDYSHAEGYYTIAAGRFSHAEGFGNVEDSSAIHQVGLAVEGRYGVGERRDAFRITQDGKLYAMNIGGFDGTIATADLTTEKDLASVITDLTNRIVALEAKQTTT